MSFKTYTARNNNKAKKGISPVIATVILVAVAVVIAAALAGFSSSLFGTYSSAGGAITVKSVTVSASTGVATVQLSNGGNVGDKLTSIQALPNTAQTTFTNDSSNDASYTAGSFSISPGHSLKVDADIKNGGVGFANGQTITLKISMQSGAQLTESVVVTA